MNVMQRHFVRRLCLWLLATGVLTFVPAISIAATTQDSVTASGSACGGILAINAQSGPNGVNPTGQLTCGHFLSGPITCLNVENNSTVLLVAQTSKIGPLAVRVTDNDPSGTDRIEAISGLGCLTPQPAYTDLEFSGSLEVTKALVLPSSKDQCKNGGWRNYPQFSSEAACLRFVIESHVTIAHVHFEGGPRNPKIVIQGEGFGLPPAADPAGGTSNLGKCGPIAGNTGNDYGTRLWIDDHSQLWSAGNLPFVDCMGLVLKSYSDDRIVYRLGSFYRINYAHRNDFAYGIYKLSWGDQVTVNVKGAQFNTRVRYGAP